MERKSIKLKIDSKEEIREMSIDEVYEQFKNFIYKSCQSWLRQYEFDDLCQIASIGLTKAYNKYDVSKDILFLTYAARIVQNEILMYNRKNKENYFCDSLNRTILGKDDSEEELQSFIPDSINIEDDVVQKYQCIELQEVIENLTDRDKEIVTEIAFNEKTQLQLSEKLGLSQSYVSRIYSRTLKTIKGRMENDDMPHELKITREQLLKDCLVLGTSKTAQQIIADTYGFSNRLTVGNYISKFKIKEEMVKIKEKEMKDEGEDIKVRKEDAKITREQLLKECMAVGTSWSSAKKIADKYGLAHATIGNYINRMKIREEIDKMDNNKKPEENNVVENPILDNRISKEIVSDNIKLSKTINRNPALSKDNIVMRDYKPKTWDEYAKDHDGDVPRQKILENRSKLRSILRGNIGEYDITGELIAAKINGSSIIIDESEIPELIEELQELMKAMKGMAYVNYLKNDTERKVSND